jgi:hypothetical protein
MIPYPQSSRPTALLFLIVAACAAPPQKPALRSVPSESPRPQLIDVSAHNSLFLELKSNAANTTGAIGGWTGQRNEWYRFYLRQGGLVEATLAPRSDVMLTFQLFDDTVVVHPDLAKDLGFALALTQSKTLSAPLKAGVYYLRVGCDQGSSTAEYALSLSVTPDPTRIPVQTAITNPAPQPPKRIAPPKPKPASAPKRTIPATPQKAAEPAPVVLAEPSRGLATPLRAGTAAAEIGTQSGVRWKWYKLDLASNSNVRISLKSNGSPVDVTFYDENGTAVEQLNVDGGRMREHQHNYKGSVAYVRVGPSHNDSPVRITMDVRIKPRDRRAGFEEVQ